VAGRPVVPRRFDEKPKEEGATPKEQRDGTTTVAPGFKNKT